VAAFIKTHVPTLMLLHPFINHGFHLERAKRHTPFTGKYNGNE
jgi:hypothetical protein